MSFTKKTGGKALDALQNLPRITLANLRPEPGSKKLVSMATSMSLHNKTLANVARQPACSDTCQPAVGVFSVIHLQVIKPLFSVFVGEKAR